MFNRTLGCALCLLLCLAAPAAWAKCSFKQGYMKSVYKVELPADLDFPQDLAPGRMLYSSAWQNATGVRIACNASGRVSGRVAGHIGPLLEVPGWYNGGMHSTNVPGVGVAVYWCNRGNSCEPSLPVTNTFTVVYSLVGMEGSIATGPMRKGRGAFAPRPQALKTDVSEAQAEAAPVDNADILQLFSSAPLASMV